MPGPASCGHLEIMTAPIQQEHPDDRGSAPHPALSQEEGDAGQPSPQPSPIHSGWALSQRERGKAHDRQPNWRGFSVQLFLITILPLTILLLVVVFGSQALHHDAMRDLVGDRDLRTVIAAAGALERELEIRAGILQMLAAGLDSGLDTSPIPADVLKQPETARLFDRGVALFGADGKPIYFSRTAIDWQNDPYVGEPFLEAIRRENGVVVLFRSFSNARNGALVIAGVAAGQQNVLVGAFTPALMIEEATHTLIRTGETLVLVVARADVGSQADTGTAADSADGENNGFEVLYQGGSSSVSGNDSEHGVYESLNGQTGIHYPDGHEGETLVAFAPVATVGWGLVIEEAWEDIASPYLSTTQSAPLVIVPVFLLALVALWFGVRRIVRPLQELEKQAARLSEGDFEAIQHPVGGIQEIRSLQGKLSDMAQNLQTAQHALHGYIGAITAGVENERRSLARDLHDDTIQSLIALNQRIQLALLATPQGQKDGLAELQGLVQQTMTGLRRMIRGLRPIYLEDLGLTASLKMLVQEVSQAASLPVSFELHGSERRLDPQTEMSLYRMVQESLSNVTHHAGSKQARVDMTFGDHELILTVKDDGKGFPVPADPSTFAERGHYGLLGLQERAELIGAELDIRSYPGEGTTVSILLPLPKSDTGTR